MAEFYVEQQGWVRWPKVLIMCRKDGRDVTHRRYVPEVETGEGMSITKELREWAEEFWEFSYSKFGDKSNLIAIADRIDEEHERAMADAYLSGTPTDEKLAELGWVRKNKEHVISHATVEVTPHIDWSRMADELDEFVEIVRGMAGGAE